MFHGDNQILENMKFLLTYQKKSVIVNIRKNNISAKIRGGESLKRPKKEWDGGVPDWAWGITWGIMALAILLTLILIVVRLLQ